MTDELVKFIDDVYDCNVCNASNVLYACNACNTSYICYACAYYVYVYDVYHLAVLLEHFLKSLTHLPIYLVMHWLPFSTTML